MKYTINGKHIKQINTEITLPASKSIANRALIINALSSNAQRILNLSNSDDTKVLYKALKSSTNIFDVGHAGTAMRFLTAYLSQQSGQWVITGSDRMKQRPIKVLVDALMQLGAKIEYIENDGFPPLRISGSKLIGKRIELDGSISSQYISALLMIAPKIKNGLTLKLTNKITSRSYIEMTLGLMNQFGVVVNWKSENEIEIKEQTYKPIQFVVESDWSAASYCYELLSLVDEGEIKLPNLKLQSLQGDCKIAQWFEAFGIKSKEYNGGIVLIKTMPTKPEKLNLDFILNPDVAQTMAVLCVAQTIPFNFVGLETLKIKETNRITALQTELKKLGALLIELKNGELTWDGNFLSQKENTPTISTYNDHRMALAFAPIALLKEIKIDAPMVVTKSYPNYYNDLKSIGFTIE